MLPALYLSLFLSRITFDYAEQVGRKISGDQLKSEAIETVDLAALQQYYTAQMNVSLRTGKICSQTILSFSLFLPQLVRSLNYYYESSHSLTCAHTNAQTPHTGRKRVTHFQFDLAFNRKQRVQATSTTNNAMPLEEMFV